MEEYSNMVSKAVCDSRYIKGALKSDFKEGIYISNWSPNEIVCLLDQYGILTFNNLTPEKINNALHEQPTPTFKVQPFQDKKVKTDDTYLSIFAIKNKRVMSYCIQHPIKKGENYIVRYDDKLGPV